MPWDSDASVGRICSDISEYEEFEKLFKDLSLKDKDFIEDSSGCLYPCKYLEYRVGDERSSSMSKFGLWVVFGSLVTTVKEEFYLYPFISLVSDFGGSLGLFVGFSFYGLWDILPTILHLKNLGQK